MVLKREKEILKYLGVKNHLWVPGTPSNLNFPSDGSPEYAFQHRHSDTKQNSRT